MICALRDSLMRCGKSGSGRRVFGVSTPFVPRPRPLRSGGIPGAGVHADAGAPLYVAIPRLMIVTAPLSNAVEAGAPLYVAIPRSMCNLQLLAPLASRASRPSPLVSRPPSPLASRPRPLRSGGIPGAGVHADAGAPLYVAIPRSMCNLQLLAPLASLISRRHTGSRCGR
jgi:hypothetical protein